MKAGIIGLPNAGKSTIFNALARTRVPCESYPFCTIDPNVGAVPVPDPRLERIAAITRPERAVPAMVEFLDVAGLVRGANLGEGLGNQFLSHVREASALLHVVRLFEEGRVAHVEGALDPLRDRGIVETELLLADLQVAERALSRARRESVGGEGRVRKRLASLEVVHAALSDGIPLRRAALGEGDLRQLREFQFLTLKPVMLVSNIGEADIAEAGARLLSFREASQKEGIPFVEVCGKLEAEIGLLEEGERDAYLKDYGLEGSALERLVRAAYRMLRFITFFSTESAEVRAWSVTEGTKAPQAAGKIHTDMEKGFIKAEIISFEKLEDAGSLAKARETGLLRVEGKDYVVQDGDVIRFRFA